MRFKVPKFLEREIKVVGFLTFKQLALVGSSALFLVVLFYIIPRAIFFLLVVVVGFVMFGLLFIKIDGVPLSHILSRSLGFFLSPRTYVWKKKENLTPIRLIEKRGKREQEKEEKSPLRISPGSRLKKLASRIELGIR